jgi:hypothetical protein
MCEHSHHCDQLFWDDVKLRSKPGPGVPAHHCFIPHHQRSDRVPVHQAGVVLGGGSLDDE